MRRILTLLLALMLAAAPLCAQAYTDPLPEEVEREIHWFYGDQIGIEDYICVGGDETCAYSFALLRDADLRRLAVFTAEPAGSTFGYQYCVIDAVPQGGAGASFHRHDENTVHLEKDGQARFYEDRLGFTVCVRDRDEPEQVEATVSYHYMDGAFRLTGFMDRRSDQVCVFDGGMLHYEALGRAEFLGAQPASLIAEMAYVDYEALPKTLAAAQEANDIPPAFPYYDHPYWNPVLRAQVVPFDGGRNHKVYMGPGDEYPRSGNGKGTVSTNDWVQVFGAYDGFLLIQYHIDGDRYRIGWIDDSAMTRGRTAAALDWNYDGFAQQISETCVLTDDPLSSRSPIAILEPGTQVHSINRIGTQWELVRVEVDGEIVFGFIPADCVTHG